MNRWYVVPNTERLFWELINETEVTGDGRIKCCCFVFSEVVQQIILFLCIDLSHQGKTLFLQDLHCQPTKRTQEVSCAKVNAARKEIHGGNGSGVIGTMEKEERKCCGGC